MREKGSRAWQACPVSLHPKPVAERGTKGGSGARVVLTCVGFLGDLHPYLAIGQELVHRGHSPVIATVPGHRQRVEASGLAFHPLRAMTAEEPTPELVRRVFGGRRGIEFIIRELILPALRTAYEDTGAVAAGADLLVSHPLTIATRLVAEARGLPWISTQLAPSGVLSAEDPSLFPGLGWLYRLHPPAVVWRAVWRLADRVTRRWLRPYDGLRRQLGLPDFGNPLFAGGHSPWRELGLFSPRFGVPQVDWPPRTVATGFPFLAQAPVENPALERWLAAGPAPVIFTLGSSAVMDPGSFFHESARAAERIGRRALLLGALFKVPGSDLEPRSPVLPGADTDVFAADYIPYAQVFPRAVAIVHQGGIGTTSEALRAGPPMLVVPFGADQPDNAARAKRLGVAEVLTRRQYQTRNIAAALRLLLERGNYRMRAQEMGTALEDEDGVATACDFIEAAL